jgi:NAD(P)-dependent dehydrogenase (short-subunit alcohol dehydrogenase family)
VTWVVEKEAHALQEELGSDGSDLALIRCDVTDPAAVSEALTSIERRWGNVDVLAHLVGAWRGGEQVQKHSLETWDRMMNLNLTSAFLTARAVLPAMLERDWGRLIFVSSRTALSARAGQAAYAIAKAGVAILAETISEETRGSGVTANVVAPSTLDTPANRAAMPDADADRWVTPDDVAEYIVFLASEAAGRLRGGWLPAYGAA